MPRWHGLSQPHVTKRATHYQGKALPSAIGGVLPSVRKVADPTLRLRIAHDTWPHILGASASLHLLEFSERQAGYGAFAMNDKTGRWKFTQNPEQRQKSYPHRPDTKLPNTRLKCPAHAVRADNGDTNMQYLVHAGINLAAEQYGLL